MVNKKLENYKLLSLLGTGGMSEVYLARNTKTGAKAAIKILDKKLSKDPEYIKRFKREVEISKTLFHPNIIKIMSSGTDKGRYYIVYEYIEGMTLDRYIKSKKLSIKEIEDITLQILKGLSYAHSKNIIHRDIKPSNIMISNGSVKILDFGIARATTKSTITKTGMFMGSPHYTSPEQIDGKKIDHRTDIYSLGIVLYEMIEGKVPFQADTPLGFVRAHLDKPVPKIKRKVPDCFKDIAYKCLAKNPSERFSSAKEIEKVIRNNIADKEKTVIKTTDVVSKRKEGLSAPMKAGIVVGSIIVISIVTFILLIGHADSFGYKPTEITDSDETIEIEINGDIPNVLYISEDNYIDIKITNNNNFTWQSGSFRISYHIFKVDDDLDIKQGVIPEWDKPNGSSPEGNWGNNVRSFLLNDIEPGDTADIKVKIYWETEGTYILEIEPLVEHSYWFSQRGVSPLTGEVEFIIRENKIPVADIYGPDEGFVEEEIEFDASGSFDEDGAITEYIWEFGDGNNYSGSEEKVNHIYGKEGNYTIKLTVMDGQGDMSESSTVIAITDRLGEIAFVSDRDGDFEIYLMNTDGNNIVKLTDNTSNDWEPSWSPDGSKILFRSYRDGYSSIYIMDSDGKNVIKLTDNTYWDGGPIWSPDGSKVAFYSERNKKYDIYVINSDGTEEVKLSDIEYFTFNPTWSPDGSKIAFSSDNQGEYNTYVMNSDGTDIVKDNSVIDWSYSWLPDRSKCVFTSYRDGDSEIYIRDSDGRNLVQLTDNDSFDQNPCFSPGGSKIIFYSDLDGDLEIYIMNSDGSNLLKLTDNESDDFIIKGACK